MDKNLGGMYGYKKREIKRPGKSGSENDARKEEIHMRLFGDS